VATPRQPARDGAAGEVRGRWAAVRGLGSLAGRLSSGPATWLGSFLVLAVVLVVRNAYLFSTKIYENQDYAANTIAILQAKHLGLLTGNYSKEGFYHPGPAFLYVMTAGESVFHDLLHVVPTPWNGQLLAILLLNAALTGASLAVLARYARSRWVTLAGLAVVLVFVAVHPLTVNSEWMPYVYFTPALLLLASGASVATGETGHLPLLALSAALCINGQAEFLLFAPVTVLVALGGLIGAHRHNLRDVFRGRGREWAGALAVAALLFFPIALYTAQHWPGQFGNYLSYRTSMSAQHVMHPSLGVSVKYVLRFWWPGTPTSAADQGGLWVAVAAIIIALALALTCPRPGLRRFMLWSLGMVGLMSILFVYYARTSVSEQDILTQAYLGYFYWAAPLMVVIVAAAGAVAYLDGRRAALLALAAVVAGAAVIATVVPQHRDNSDNPPAKYYGVPQLPHVVSVLAAAAGGRPIVIRIVQGNWMHAVGVVAYADRTGVRSCVAGPHWNVLFRAQSLCTRQEIRTGVTFWFTSTPTRVPRGASVVASFPQPPATLVTRQPLTGT
jgi:hypothetical protein